MSTIHVYGFFDDEEHPRLSSASVTRCPDGETPYEAFLRVLSNIEHFGGEIDGARYTWPLGERRMDAVRIDFEAPAHGAAARMWHILSEAKADEWRRKPDPIEESA